MEEIKPSLKTLDRLCAIANEIIGYENIKTIFEFGSRYGEDTVEFAKRYPRATIYGFECNKSTLLECRERTSTYSNIVLTEKAVTEIDGPTSFFPINKEKTTTTWSDGNQGASSLFRASGKYEIEDYVQDEDVVEGISLKSFMDSKGIDGIDLIWMDVQGAELMAMKGLGEKLGNVKIIQAEVEFIEIYKGQPLFEDFKNYLISNYFDFIGFNSMSCYSGDAIFANKQCLSEKAREICRSQLIHELPIIKKDSLMKRFLKSFFREFPFLRNLRK